MGRTSRTSKLQMKLFTRVANAPIVSTRRRCGNNTRAGPSRAKDGESSARTMVAPRRGTVRGGTALESVSRAGGAAGEPGRSREAETPRRGVDSRGNCGSCARSARDVHLRDTRLRRPRFRHQFIGSVRRCLDRCPGHSYANRIALTGGRASRASRAGAAGRPFIAV